ncbi:MAG: phosphoglucosamine mutase, partial [Candidatus Saccharibacteria bacterium]|nr:phosphoglucosamine mutase [Candidatus Saccharibacteria bacterium]
DGGKLPDSTENELNNLIDSEIPNRETGVSNTDTSLVAKYEDYLVETMNNDNLEGLNIVLDSANGATSGVAMRVFERLKANVLTIFDDPDGININDHCGATDTIALQSTVLDKKLDCGAAFDGDGDRLIMVDSKGRQMDGDYIMYILANTDTHSGVVATIMSNMGLEIALNKQNIKLHRTVVGDRYVLEGLEDTGYYLGGEQSGHIILPKLSTTGDGLLAAIQTLRFVAKSKKTLDEWHDELKLLPQFLVNIPLADKTLLEREDIKEYISKQSMELQNNGRLLIRPSGTEPKARVMVESPDAEERAKEIAETLTKLMDK